jgi:hypothetical protein
MQGSAIREALFFLQFFQVAFLLLHDWIPLGRLNDIPAVRRENSLRFRVIGTLVSSLPFAIGLILTGMNLNHSFPRFTLGWLWVSYLWLFLGELQAWWIPYFLTNEPKRAARYAAMFGNTHAFLPARHGILPNTLHVILHMATLVTLILLGIYSFWPG